SASRTPECGFDATNWLWVTFDRGIQHWAGGSPDYHRSFNGFCASVHVTVPSQQPAHDPVAAVDFVGLYPCLRDRARGTGAPNCGNSFYPTIKAIPPLECFRCSGVCHATG